MRIILGVIFLLVGFANQVRGQYIDIKHTSRDTSYIKDFYTNYFILRVFECTKFSNFKLIDGHNRLIYKQNHHNDLGIGFKYKLFSLNIEFAMPFTEKNRNMYGATHSFDVQTFFYIKNFVIDIYTQFYNGYYLSNNDKLLSDDQQSQLMIRPDIRTTDLGLKVTYIHNDKQFSFNAPFTQNEIQRKSAGSLLAGGGIYYSKGEADSSFIPALLQNAVFFQNRHFNKFSYISIGCNLGYAYTQIIKKQFFITGAMSAGPGIGYSEIKYNQPDKKDGKFGITYNGTAKFAAGWSSNIYFVGVTYLRLLMVNNSVVSGTREEGNVGNFQFTVARRFLLKKALIPKSNIIKID